MTGIKANPDKSHLLTINTKQQNISVNFNNQDIFQTQAPIRHLGVWHEQEIGRKYNKHMVMEATKSFINRIIWKRTTDKQLNYLTNQVLFPKIEYLLNDVCLTRQECENINKKIRKLIKNKTGFASTAPNTLIHGQANYKIFDLHYRQIQKHINDLTNRFSRKDSVGLLTRENIQNIQWFAWTHKDILNNCPKIWKKSFSFTHDILRYAQNEEITLTENSEYITIIKPTKHTHIIEEMGETWFDKHRQALRKNNIM
jgi:hypothetical protein